MSFAEDLGRRLDVEHAVTLLCANDPGVVKEYLSDLRRLKQIIEGAQRQVSALRRELFSGLATQRSLPNQVVGELEEIRARLNSSVTTGPDLPQPTQIPYEGHGKTDSVIPADCGDATRDHGAPIMRIVPEHGTGSAELHIRILLNCHCPESNSVRIAIFQDGCDHPLAVLTQDLIPAAELTLVDQDVFIAIPDASKPPVLEVRVGLARTGGTLSINHVPTPALISAVRLQWLPAENELSGLDEIEVGKLGQMSSQKIRTYVRW
jgi:hypothetical protein